MTYTNQPLQIALDANGSVVSIFKVPTGLACNCLCPVCKEPLEAKNKNKMSNEALVPGQKIAHFAHNDGSICAGAAETAIHRFAKEVLTRTKKLMLPPLFVNEIQVSEPVILNFDKVEKEMTINY